MTDLGTRPGRALRRAAPALLGYAAVRALGLLTLALWSAARDKSAYTLLTARWDALWYTRVAELGYGYEVRLPNGDVHSNLAFFPLLPWLERLLSALTPMSYADAGFVVSLLASLAAAWGVFAVTDHVYGGRAGVCAVLLWAVLPVGIVQSMAYSESLFTALAAWSLYAVLTGRWVTAGLLASLAGLTRPVGLAVVAAVWVTGAATFLRERRDLRNRRDLRDLRDRGETTTTTSARDQGQTTTTTGDRDQGQTATTTGQQDRSETATVTGQQDRSKATAVTGEPDRSRAAGPPSGRNRSAADAGGARAVGHAPETGTASLTGRAPDTEGARTPSHSPGIGMKAGTSVRRALGMALAPLGTAAYVLWVGHRTGKGPLGYLDVQAGWRNGFDGGYAFARFVGDKFTSFPSALAGAGLIVGVALIIWLYVICVRQGQPLPLLVYAGVVTALALCASSYFGSKPRLLMPAFPLLLPLALALSRARTRRSAAVVATVALVSALYGAFWLNGSGPP
ncbi:mannosyltransferase family protein [Streptomyces griseorubiginosus]|uniref:mannosyltransferase family protein n=1 Tax=Streptomyces griseorubiginosus TaxID=67304 RepID=UPI00215B3068|nr:mannosyltransferase family protein [Streptomyces griseorubiginosus]